jgi:hypothetical protein
MAGNAQKGHVGIGDREADASAFFLPDHWKTPKTGDCAGTRSVTNRFNIRTPSNARC